MSSALPLYEDSVEIPYVSFDDRSRCYFYSIRVVRTFRLTGEKQVSNIKRRRFREFLQLHKDILAPSSDLILPSKFFSTSPEARKPKLELYLRRLLREDLKSNDGKMSRTVEKFLGLDVKNAFPPKSMTFDEFEKRNPLGAEERKQILSVQLTMLTVGFFLPIETAHLLMPWLPTKQRLGIGFLCMALTMVLLILQERRARQIRKRAFELEQQLQTSTVKLDHKPVDDASISKAEADNLPKLRERLVDFVSGTTPEYDADFLKTHGEVCRGLNRASLTQQSNNNNNNETDSLSGSASESVRKDVWDKSVLVDHRLVPFLRYNGNNLDKAESQARFAMTVRVALGLENIHSVFDPPRNVLDYAGSPMLQQLTQRVDEQRAERLERWWLRDREGCLCMFVRMGHVPTGKVFELGFNKDADLLNRTMIWFVEMFKKDLDEIHEKSKGRIIGQCTVVADMNGFDLNTQLGTSDVLNMVKKYVPLMAPNYAGLLKRYIVINAPWYVNMLLSIVRPFIPKDILDSVRIYSGFDKQKMIDPFIEDKYIPKYLGGELVGENGDEFCRDRIAPYGPFEPDAGMSLLIGPSSSSSSSSLK